MQQQSQSVVQSRRIRPTRLIRHAHHFTAAAKWQNADGRPVPDTSNEDIDISLLDTHHFLPLSGMLQAIQVEKQRTGAFPRLTDVDGREVTDRTIPLIPLTPVPTPFDIALPVPAKEPSTWRVILYAPATKIIVGLIIGIGLLFLTAQFVNIPT